MGGILSYLQVVLGGFCPSKQKRVGGILSGGDFVRIPNSLVQPDIYLIHTSLEVLSPEAVINKDVSKLF